MFRFTIYLLAFVFFACNSKQPATQDTEFTYDQFANSFKNASLPFQLTDTFLIKNKDTASIRGGIFTSLLPDSVRNKLFGKGDRVNYIPLWKIDIPGGEHYYLIKTESKNKRAVFLFVFDKENELTESFPFLVPDTDVATMQVSSIDKAYSISKTVFRKQLNEVAEGKDVYAYDAATKKIVLVMTDPLDEKNAEMVNPIDTLSKLHKLAGDYIRDKKNIVSVRDGRKTNLLTVFVHIEKGGDCVGEVKGDAAITSPTTAIYQQAGDPCVLQLNFSGNKVTLTELEGCGSRRGLDCIFEGSFTRKKPLGKQPVKAKKKTSGK